MTLQPKKTPSGSKICPGQGSNLEPHSSQPVVIAKSYNDPLRYNTSGSV